MEEETDSMYKDASTPKWLKTIQLNSWEAELLISALVLYALFQIPDYLKSQALQMFDRGSNLHGLIGYLIDAIRILSLGYILHIIVRGTWVASVGLSYVFPKGVNAEELKFKGKFRKELKKNGSLVKMVLKLEQLSSIIYSISFILFGIVIGFTCFLFSLISFFEWMQSTFSDNITATSTFGYVLIFYVFLSLIVFFDFITNGLLRRKEWSADWFYYVALVFRVVTLSFLYRQSLLVLISNTKGWKKYLIPFVILGVIGGYRWINGARSDHDVINYYTQASIGNYNDANYENTRSTSDYLGMTIQSDIVSDNVLKVFLQDIGTLGNVFLYEDKDFDKDKWDRIGSDSVSLYFNKRLKIQIDGEKVGNLEWHKNQHPITEQFGFTTFIDIDSLERGKHYLHLGMDTIGLSNLAKELVDKKDYSLQSIGNIYFFYDKP